jgi:maltase-glucoamylase
MVNFGDLPQFVAEHVSQGVRFIVILDPAINTEKNNHQAHINAMANQVCITWANGKQPDKNCTASPGNCQPLDNVILGYMYGLMVISVGRNLILMQLNFITFLPFWDVPAFPDFFKNRTATWWQEISDTISYHGVWIVHKFKLICITLYFNYLLIKPQDMNEPDAFDTNTDKPFNLASEKPFNKWDDPPYNT